MKFPVVKYARLVVFAAAVLCGPGSVCCAEPQWEPVTVTAPAAADDNGDASERFEAVYRGGYLYVTLGRSAQVKLYTILGQLVSQRTLPAGTSRLRMRTRGIYILKTDIGTKRITV